MTKLLGLISICCLVSGCQSYKLLAFLPFPSDSHHNIFFPLLHELARVGHQVTYYTPVEPRTTHPNLTVRLTKPNYKNDFMRKLDLIPFGQASLVAKAHTLLSLGEEFADRYYGNPVAQEIIHSTEKYDAVLMESFFMQEPVSALIHKFGCVAIEISTLADMAWINEWSGLPNNPAYQVDFEVAFSDDMTVLERLYNIYGTASTLFVSYFHMYRMQAIMDKYFNYPGWESRPPLETLLPNKSMILINADPALNYPYPTAPHVKNIGGMNLRPNKPLPKDLQKFMDDAKEGVIYFSLGSNLNTSDIMTGNFGEAFINVFRILPQKVLIKWENNKNDAKLPTNVKTSKWFPQNDILAHKNCVMFITHGGFLSLTETVYHGIPIIGIPFFGDQPKNVVHAQTVGYGLILNYDNVTEDSVSWALNEVIKNPRYREVAQKRSLMLRDRRYSALEEAVYKVVYAIKYPNILTPRSAFMSFWERRVFQVETFFFLSIAGTYIAVSLFFCAVRKIKSKYYNKKLKML